MKLIKIFSHPRSGTHLLQHFLALNFFKDIDLKSGKPIIFGHWSKDETLEEDLYFKLLGNHFFPNHPQNQNIKCINSIYIYRDGRDVAYSIWKSGFYNKTNGEISFPHFLRKKIDWYGGTRQKIEPDMTIAEHWFKHVNEWQKQKDILFVKYEDLVEKPEQVILQIAKYFNLFEFIKYKIGIKHIRRIDKPIGIKPNNALINTWKKVYSNEDNAFFISKLPNTNYLYSE